MRVGDLATGREKKRNRERYSVLTTFIYANGHLALMTGEDSPTGGLSGI